MDKLSELSVSQLMQVIDKLEMHTVGYSLEQAVDEVVVGVSDEAQSAVLTLHCVLCSRDHDNNECRWYVEESVAEKWSLPEHQLWLTLWKRLSSLNLPLLRELVEFLEERTSTNPKVY